MGLRVVNVSDPAAPREVGSYATPGSASDLAVAGDYVYLAEGDGGLLILRLAGYGLYLPLVRRIN